MNAAYRIEKESEQELYLYTVKENSREKIFANIDYVDSGGDKHKIKMKVDTGANGNIIPLRIYQKMYPRDISNKMGKPTTIRRDVTTLWAVNSTKIPHYESIGLMSRVFANGPEDRSSIPGRVIPKIQKMVFDAASLNTQIYEVMIKGKVEQSRECSSAVPY